MACYLTIAVSLFGGSLHAQLPRTRLNSIFPAGAAAQSTETVTINGELTDAATELIFSHSGIDATQQLEAPTEYTTAHRKARTFDVTVASDVPNGRYDVRAFGPAGLSAPRTFVVSRLTEKRFHPEKNSRQTPFGLSVGEVANAKARADERDYYRFTATKGQALLVQVWADRIDSKMDPVLSVYDVATGKRVGRASQGLSRDPVMTFSPPADGEYLVEVWDLTYRGGEEYVYRLEISAQPYAEAIHPIVAKPGVQAEFSIYGYNLPGGTPISQSTRMGNLQSLQVSFAPQFDQPFASGLSVLEPSSARANGGTVGLPVPLSGQSVFLGAATGKVTNETEQGNDSATDAQTVDIPVDVAGRFFPRRDVDWYRFSAEKGRTYWVEIAAHQLGVRADPVLRLQRGTDTKGTLEFTEIVTVDDMEAAPGSPESRRFHSGTNDIAYRFKAPESGTYFLSVTDQYNTSADDPRLAYHLSISVSSPDFQLVAFPDPERHADEKIAKPNGVSLIPGGSAVVRVRLLPNRGFNSDVEVTVTGLPANVTAHPLTLHNHHPEGFLVLTASDDANLDAAPVQIQGTAVHEGETSVRVARTGNILYGVNNVAAEATRSRLTKDFVVAVTDAPPAPVSLVPREALRTSVGGRVSIPVELHRLDDRKETELEIESALLPRLVKLTSAKTKSNHAEVSASFDDPKLRPGRYSFPLMTKLKQERPRNVILYREAQADLQKIAAVLAERDQQVHASEKELESLVSLVEVTERKYEAVQSQTQEPRNRLAAKLQQQQAAVAELAKRLEESLADVSNPDLRAAVSQAEADVAQLRQDRKSFEASLATALAPLSNLTKEVTERTAELEALQEQTDALRQKRDEAKAKKEEAEKKVEDTKKAQLEQEFEFWIYSAPVHVDVASSPVTLVCAEKNRISLGSAAEIAVGVHRHFGFDGPITLTARFPTKAGLTSVPLVIGPGQQIGKVSIHSSGHTPVGTWTGSIEAQLKFNSVEISDSLSCVVEVVDIEAGKTE